MRRRTNTALTKTTKLKIKKNAKSLVKNTLPFLILEDITGILHLCYILLDILQTCDKSNICHTLSWVCPNTKNVSCVKLQRMNEEDYNFILMVSHCGFSGNYIFISITNDV